MLKTLSKSIRQYKKDSILSPLLMIIEVFFEVLIPFFMTRLVDIGISNGDMAYISKTGLILIGLAVLSLLCGAFSATFSSRAASGFSANLRHDVFSNIQKFSFSNIDKFSPSSLITRLTTDITNIMMAYQALIRQSVRAVIMIICALIMAFRINVTISSMLTVLVIVLGVILFGIILYVHPVFVKAFEKYDKLNNIVQENLHAIRVVKSFVREKIETKKFESISNEIYKEFTLAQKIVSLSNPMVQVCVYAAMILVSWLGAKYIIVGNMSTGQLMSMYTYIMYMLMSMTLLAMTFIMVIISRASAERVVAVLNEKSDIQNPKNPVFDVPNGSIRFDSVDFSYIHDNEKLSLSNINIDIKSGETIGVIGSTGSSKTSFIQLIPRLYDTTKGTVYVGGIDVKNYDIESLRNQVSVVLQQNVLFSGTIKENLRWGNKDATDEQIEHVCKLAQANTFIETFPDKYDTYIEQGGSNVSGGQKQRLCIARALLKKPRILILDDSTSAVDTKTDFYIRKALREEIPETTKIIIAQRISSVEDCDRIIVMDNGMVNAIGTHDELINSNKIYKEVYESQVQSGGDFDAES